MLMPTRAPYSLKIYVNNLLNLIIDDITTPDKAKHNRAYILDKHGERETSLWTC